MKVNVQNARIAGETLRLAIASETWINTMLVEVNTTSHRVGKGASVVRTTPWPRKFQENG